MGVLHSEDVVSYVLLYPCIGIQLGRNAVCEMN